jgi:hypothetical protein
MRGRVAEPSDTSRPRGATLTLASVRVTPWRNGVMSHSMTHPDISDDLAAHEIGESKPLLESYVRNP